MLEYFGGLFYLLANLFGFVAACLYLYSDVQSDDKRLDHFYTLGNVSFVFHLVLMASFLPAITVAIAVFRNVLVSLYDNSLMRIVFVLVFLSLFLYASVGAFNGQNWWDSLPALCSLLMTFGFLYTKANVLTFVMIVCSVLWLVVGVCIGSYSVIALELISILLLLYRFCKVSKQVCSDEVAREG